MMKYGKKILAGLLAASVSASLAGGLAECAQQDTKAMTELVQDTGRQLFGHLYKNKGLSLRVPYIYDRFLHTEMLAKENGMLYSVSELASREAAVKENLSAEGAGWLFGIGTVSADRLHDMLQVDMSGVELFAKDEQGKYYLFYHPTDVRYMRATPEEMETDQEQWSKLNFWAWNAVRRDFVKDNAGLQPLVADNSDLGISLAEIAYGGALDYQLVKDGRTLNAQPDFSALEFAEKLLYDHNYQIVNAEKTPKGKYLSLKFPRENVRFDFFTDEGSEDFVREIRKGMQDIIYQRVQGESAGKVMADWYAAMQVHGEMAQLGYSADSLVGTWAEKIAGRGVITITKDEKENCYDVDIHWGSSAFETSVWQMKAVPVSSNALQYKDCRHTIVTFTENGAEQETVKYENGTGKFTLNSVHEIMWQDDVEHAGDDAVFVSAKE